MTKRIAAILFHAPLGHSPAEQLVESGRWASARGLARRLRAVGVTVHVVTPDPARCPEAAGLVSFSRSPASGFQFGDTLARLCAELDLDGVVYFGSGAGGLLLEEDVARLVKFASGDAPRALLNNYYSCDFCAISRPRDALAGRLPEIDNPLGFALADAGVPCFALERTVETQFDIDTPIDLHVLARSDRGGPDLRAFCAALPDAPASLDRALAALTDRSAVTTLIGRLSPATWSRIERDVACRTSALVEGRGMRAGGADRVPWLHQAVEHDGASAFFDRLARSCDAAWIDTRPLLGNPAEPPPARDRFASDLLLVEEILDPTWRSFTDAARRASIPVVLGGHNLVNGGLFLAAEACWKGRNLARRLHPDFLSDAKERS
jgi:hypothetical protein